MKKLILCLALLTALTFMACSDDYESARQNCVPAPYTMLTQDRAMCSRCAGKMAMLM